MSTAPSNRIDVMLVDDHAVVREGYRRLLERAAGLVVVGEAASMAEALRLDAELKPDVIVLDIALPGVSGIEVLRRLTAHRPEAKVLIFSMYQDGIYATHAMNAGARGYLSKASAPDLLVSAVRAVADGGQYISPDVEQAMTIQSNSAVQLAQSFAHLSAITGLLFGRQSFDVTAAMGGVIALDLLGAALVFVLYAVLRTRRAELETSDLC